MTPNKTQSLITHPTGNLEYVTDETRTKIEALLSDDSVRFAVKDIIQAGLNRDCLDAVRDAKLAAKMLELVYVDCMRIVD